MPVQCLNFGPGDKPGVWLGDVPDFPYEVYLRPRAPEGSKSTPTSANA